MDDGGTGVEEATEVVVDAERGGVLQLEGGGVEGLVEGLADVLRLVVEVVERGDADDC